MQFRLRPFISSVGWLSTPWPGKSHSFVRVRVVRVDIAFDVDVDVNVTAGTAVVGRRTEGVSGMVSVASLVGVVLTAVTVGVNRAAAPRVVVSAISAMEGRFENLKSRLRECH